MSEDINAPRQLSRHETHDLSMIIKERTKVLTRAAEAQAAACMADFERKLEAMFAWDNDETWRKAAGNAQAAVDQVRDIVAEKYEALGIPRIFAPDVGISFTGRGPSALNHRRAEMRSIAKTSVDAMLKAAITTIERQGLDLRTKVVSMGLLSDDARLFLESLAPVEETMRNLDFKEIELRLEKEHEQRRLRGGYG